MFLLKNLHVIINTVTDLALFIPSFVSIIQCGPIVSVVLVSDKILISVMDNGIYYF